MLLNNAELTQGVISSRGNALITNFKVSPPITTPHDCIDYLTGRPLPIMDIICTKHAPSFKLTFSDDRSFIVNENDDVYLNGKVQPLSAIFAFIGKKLNLLGDPIWFRDNDRLKQNIAAISDDVKRDLKRGAIVEIPPRKELTLNPCRPIEFEKPFESVRPDPYTAGYILPEADLTIEEVNGVGDRTDMLQSILTMNNLEMVPLTVDKIMVKPRGNMDKDSLKWKDFFSDVITESRTYSRCTKDIPYIYQILPYQQRLEFLRGFFDANFMMPPWTGPVDFEVSIRYLGRLKYVQEMLWSVGIHSRIWIYNRKADRRFNLTVLTNARKFQTLFNDVHKIERLRSNKDKSLEDTIDVTLRSIEYVGECRHTVPVFTRPGTIYTTDNYLPKVGSSVENSV